MATAKQTINSDRIVNIPLRDIVADFSWNTRSGDWTKGEGDDEGDKGGHSFADLVASIENKGQDTPATVRPKGKKFELIVGFRRFKAISVIAEKLKNKDATIKCVVKALNDAEARSENLRENTGRENLEGPDLAFGIWDLFRLHKDANGGKEPTTTALANEISKNQSYVALLLRIMANVKPSLTKAWREAPVQLSVREMDVIGKLENKEEQEKKYKQLLSGKGGGKAGRGAWLDSAKKKAASIGTLLGNLEREELIDTSGLSFAENLDKVMKVNEKATAAQRKAIAKAAEDAWSAAKTAAPESDEDSDDDSDE